MHKDRLGGSRAYLGLSLNDAAGSLSPGWHHCQARLLVADVSAAA